ncbi:unnamed protein product [Triticum turgidum subsp. durum]|uniref:Protein kinase domain-containing protein n=1 Tax=Triticum turgidum subsp. durum TaxID=4567 RepID=A0A9R0WHT5_TRITD|nr:unnamed protein product [Triticum turgidum subsp. durum]
MVTTLCSVALLLVVVALLSATGDGVAALDAQAAYLSRLKQELAGPAMARWDFSSATPVDYCRFQGVVCGGSNVTGIDLTSWRLTGRLPPGICAALPALRDLLLAYNEIRGGFPAGLLNCSSLETLNLSFASVSGALPDLSPMRALRALDLSDNLFSGAFPATSIANMTSLEVINFNENPGFDVWRPPEALTRLRRLRVLILSTTSMRGGVPAWLGNMTSLTFLELSGNSLTGRIPASLGRLANLEFLELYYNDLEGAIPDELGNLTRLADVDLSENHLDGAIPDSLCALPRLRVLQLYTNFLAGPIPAVLGNSTQLEILSVYKNQLTGELPADLGRYSDFNVLEVSENQLTGPLPPYACAWIVGVCCVVCVVAMLALARRWVTRRRELKDGEQDGTSSPGSRGGGLSSYDVTSFHKLNFDQHEIVEALIDKNIVGHGGSGTVYKIELSSGELVAVKKLWVSSSKTKQQRQKQHQHRGHGHGHGYGHGRGYGGGEEDDSRELRTEVETLGSIRHKNIVKLYCCYSGADCNLLVYEYMPNGNLWDALHGGAGGGWGGFGFLDWPTRRRVAIGVAQGLAYLHHDLLFTIVHRDVKSSNILLDADFEPKVADFGIAKVLQATRGGGVGGDTSSTTTIAGTYGYLAPEYAYSSKATTKCDVYSFGVVLMELATGKKPIEPEFGETRDIVQWVTGKVAAAAEAEALDKRLAWSPFKDEMVQALRVAVRCTCSIPGLRPTMADVVQMLAESGPPPGSRSAKDYPGQKPKPAEAK